MKMRVVRLLRRMVPYAVKLPLKLGLRYCRDVFSGRIKNFAVAMRSDIEFSYDVTLSQPILNATTEQSKINKIHNIKLAVASIEALEIQPQQIFSFWRAVGRPSQKNNFREGINIINGKVVEDFGGGLCQLSSIIYHVCLRAGLNTIERYSH